MVNHVRESDESERAKRVEDRFIRSIPPQPMCSSFLSVLAMAFLTILSVNPTKQLGDARNAQRRSDVNTILNATYQYAIDNNGNIPEGIPTGEPQEICDNNAPMQPCVDLGLLTGSYLVQVPRDPQAPDGQSWYVISRNEQGRITVSASRAERGATISVTR